MAHVCSPTGCTLSGLSGAGLYASQPHVLNACKTMSDRSFCLTVSSCMATAMLTSCLGPQSYETGCPF